MKKLNLDHEEKELLEELERNEWRSVISDPSDLDQFRQAARRTMKKDKRINIRISERDLLSLHKMALEEGIPYQTLISSVIHKFVSRKSETWWCPTNRIIQAIAN